MPASDQHKQYEKNLEQWELVRDCVEGSAAVKNRSAAGTSEANNNGADGGMYGLAGTRYLPPPNANDNSQENRERFWSYRKRASFVNFTGATREGLLGMIFRKEIDFGDMPPGLEYIKDNADGGGSSLDALIKDGIGDTIETGRYGILADYPEAPEGLTQAQVEAMGLAARACCYPAESIINWRWENVGAEKKLTLAVLKEQHCKQLDPFTVEEETYHRALFLKEGVYCWALYDENDEVVWHEIEGQEDPQALMYPRKADNSTWDHIPFQFFGAQNNDPDPDKSLLYDIAEVNLAHYRNSADYEESCYMVGQPTAVFAGLSQGWVDEVMKGGVQLGSRRAVLLPEGGSGSLLQANPNQLPEQGMKNKEAQMVMLGARIIQDSSGVETAEAARIRFAGQNSKLGTLIGNWEEGMENVLRWLGEFMGVPFEDPEIEINKQFYEASIDPQAVIAGIQLLDRGVIAESDMRGKLRKAGWIDSERQDEDIDEENGNADPLMG